MIINRQPESGMGLIEVLIATAILAVIMLGVSTMIVNGQNGALSVQKRMDNAELGSFIQATLTNSAACATSGLVGSNAPPLIPASQPADTISLPTLHFTNMSFDDSGGANSYFDNGQVGISMLKWHSVSLISGSIYSATVALQVNAQGKSTTQNVMGGNLLAPQYIPVIFTAPGGPGTPITACNQPAPCDSFTTTGNMSGLRNGTIYSGTSGYYTTCSGMIVQWGITDSSPSDNTFININFPKPFPHNCYSVVGSEVTDRAGFAIGCASTFQFFLRTSNHNTITDWVAYGD